MAVNATAWFAPLQQMCQDVSTAPKYAANIFRKNYISVQQIRNIRHFNNLSSVMNQGPPSFSIILWNGCYLLTPWSRVLLEKLTGFAASQEIPRIYGTPKFITILTSVRHLSLSWARSIQSTQSPPTSSRSILTLSRLTTYIYDVPHS
jgi:hypothetical protein